MSDYGGGIKIHPRYFKVREASLELSQFMIDLDKKHDLTFAEVVKLLAEQLDTWGRYAVRAERHPTDPDKKGDEE